VDKAAPGYLAKRTQERRLSGEISNECCARPYDSSAKQLIWTGRATKTLGTGGSQEKKQKNLDKAVQKLLKGFPPK
jgi:hypothetical protein